MDRMNHISASLCLALLTAPLAACADRSEIDARNYDAYEAHGHDPADEMAVLATALSIDRETATATFTLYDGSMISSSLTARPHSDWPTGCPGLDTEMEILALEGPLVIASLEFTDPVLIASCPSSSTEIVLTEDGTSSYGGIPCDRGEDACLFFSPVND